MTLLCCFLFRPDSTPSSHMGLTVLFLCLLRRLSSEHSATFRNCFCWRVTPFVYASFLRQPEFGDCSTQGYKSSAFFMKLGAALKGSPSHRGSHRVSRSVVLSVLLPNISCSILFLLLSSKWWSQEYSLKNFLHGYVHISNCFWRICDTFQSNIFLLIR